MISSVSAVSFKAAAPAAPAGDLIGSPGKYTKPEALQPKEAETKKKNGFLKTLAKVVAAVLVVGGALLVGFKKGGLKVLDEAVLANAGKMEKFKHTLAKMGEWIDTKVWQKIPGVAKKVEDVAGEAE